MQTEQCPFCATHLENAPRENAAAMICPESLLPFHLSQRQAMDAFDGWIKGLWFAPNDLKQMANLGQLSGVYMPFWTYDSMTYTHYTGQAGMITGRRNITPMSRGTGSPGRWCGRAGRMFRARWIIFLMMCWCARPKSLPRPYVDHLEPWDLAHLEGFQSAFLAGFKTERYVVSLADGFATAQQIMDVQIRRMCCQNIGGDHQQLASVQTQHVGVTFKHILLPMWLAVYRYHDKTYRILVNARTGQVNGDRPYSWIKITLAVLAGLAVLAVVIYFSAHARSLTPCIPERRSSIGG